MAMVLAEHSNEPIDLLRVMKMLAIHDIVEVDAGDTFHYHKQGDSSKEKVAADRIFGLLPPSQAAEYRSLWSEFEERTSVDARFAAAVDRIWPVFQNVARKGGTWVEFGVPFSEVVEKLKHISEGSQVLWAHVEALLQDASDQGVFERQ